MVPVVDHANAPYGPKSPDTLIRLVGNGLQTAQRLKAAMVAMACNTRVYRVPESAGQRGCARHQPD
ncbi:hypothetical protein ACU4HD_43920 [Cupriavidus basilensis]